MNFIFNNMFDKNPLNVVDKDISWMVHFKVEK